VPVLALSNPWSAMSDAWSTQRLLARPPQRADRDAYLDLFLDPSVGASLGRSPDERLGEAQILGMLSADERHWDEYGFGPRVLLEQDGAMVGRGGLRWTELEEGWAVELPWSVASEHWGRGLATEAALAAVAQARSLQLPEVIELIVPGNARSRRVAEKAGLALDGETQQAGLRHLSTGSGRRKARKTAARSGGGTSGRCRRGRGSAPCGRRRCRPSRRRTRLPGTPARRAPLRRRRRGRRSGCGSA